MTDETTATPTPAPAPTNGPQIRVLAQYIKDLSFENPNALESLKGGQPAPAIDLGIDVQARRGQGDAYEVDLNINARAARGDKIAFLCELTFTGLFQFVNVPQDSLEPLLLVEAPRMLFPFARRIVAEATRDGGFPPLYIDPIDFMSLYQSQIASKGGTAAAKPAESGESAKPAEAGKSSEGETPASTPTPTTDDAGNA